MNYIDIIILIILALFIFGGLKKGLVRSIGEILGVFVAIYLAIHFYSDVSSWLENTFSFFHGTLADIVSLIGLFIVINIIFSILVYFVDKIFSLPILNFFNHLFGAVFGLIGGIILIVIVLFIFARFQIGASAFENSRSALYVEKASLFISPLLPKDLKKISLSDFIDNAWISRLEEAINNLPTDIVNVNDLGTYLREEAGLKQSTVSDIINTRFEGKINLSSDEIKTKLQDYLNNIQ